MTGGAEFRDEYAAIDFDGMSRRQAAASSFLPKSAEEWNRRAEGRSRREKGSDYAREFLRRVDLDGVRSVLDIGCGSGNLLLPLAARVEEAWGIDFSSGMLDILARRAEEEGVAGKIRARLLAWDDDWAGVPDADVVICSRAMDVRNLKGALQKMTAKARLRCHLTMQAGGSFIGGDVYRIVQRDIVPRPGYIFAVNLLYQMGFRARVDFIQTHGGLEYRDDEEYVQSLEWRLGGLTADERRRLAEHAKTLPHTPEGHVLNRHEFEWAFLSWAGGAAGEAATSAGCVL